MHRRISLQIFASDGSVHAANIAVTADGKGVIFTATLPSTGLSVTETAFGFNSWPVITIYNNVNAPAGGLSLPAIPWRKPVN
jgi:hypothetical protein